MALEMSVTTNVRAIAASVEKGAEQVPFAIAVALTRTAQDVQTELKQGLGEHFTVRNRWVEGSIRARPAQKGDAPVAFVGSLYRPMAEQVGGGTKVGLTGDLAVPVWARATKTDTTRPSKWPGKLAKRRHFFVAPFTRSPWRVGRGAGEGDGVGLFQRLGSKRGRKHLRLWWTLTPEVKIEARWPFREIAQGVIGREIADNFWAAFEGAMASGEARALRRAERRQARLGGS